MNLCRWTLCLLLLLPLTLSFINKKVVLEKRIGTEEDMTPLCTNDTENFITFTICKIKEDDGDVVCLLKYQPGQNFYSNCTSNIKLITQNYTVFLHLMDLTPGDSGIYYCECTQDKSIFKLHLNITVEENENLNSASQMPTGLITLFGSATFLLLALILGCIIKRKLYSRRQPEPQTAEQDTDEEPIEPYSTFIETKGGLYSTVKFNKCNNT